MQKSILVCVGEKSRSVLGDGRDLDLRLYFGGESVDEADRGLGADTKPRPLPASS